jgi:hypothetical protein
MYNGKKSELPDCSDLELKRLSLKRKTCHLAAKINCDESLDPPPFSQAFPAVASPVCLGPDEGKLFLRYMQPRLRMREVIYL